MLGNIHVVLSHTSHPGNIGAAARAMKTMGLEQLYLVQPKEFPSAEATARASGADDPVRAKREQIAKWTLLANRVGYLFVAVAMALFVIAFAVEEQAAFN